MVLPNIVAAGIYDSRTAAKNIAVSKKRKTTMFEIELPLEEGGISYIDENSSPIRPNMIISVKPGQMRHTKFPFRCAYIHMVVSDPRLCAVLQNTRNFFQTDQYETYAALFSRLIRRYDSLSQNEELMLQSLVLELIYTISRESETKLEPAKASSSRGVIERTLRYIEEHLTEELSLEVIAREMSLSPIYFHKTFKAAVGKTLHDFVEEQRIKKAITLLQTTDYSLTKIAFECGFSSQSYFSYVFKRRMKQTPRKYIQEIYARYER